MNQKNPAIKRILADVKELNKHPSSRYSAAPLETNMFEWHFTIRGPSDSAFEGGMYHGRILLPSEYPFKPPNIVFLTKNGRFEVGTKICLSISAYHVETWQPAWGVRTMLEAIISFLPSEGAGAIGALDWTKEERKKLAVESRNYCCPTCGAIAALLSDPSADSGADAQPSGEIADQIAQLQMAKLTPQSSEKAPGSSGAFMNDMLLSSDTAVSENLLSPSALLADGSLDKLHNDTPLSPSALVRSAELSLPTEDNATNVLMLDSEKVEVQRAPLSAEKTFPAVVAEIQSEEEEGIDSPAKPSQSDALPKRLFESPSQTSSQPLLVDSPATGGYQFNESKTTDEIVDGNTPPTVVNTPQGLRLDGPLKVEAVDEAVLSPVSELRHRIYHTPQMAHVESVTANGSVNAPLPHPVPPAIAVVAAVGRPNAPVPAVVVAPVGVPAVAVVAPQRDAFDDVVDILLRLTGLAILCVVYRIVGREA